MQDVPVPALEQEAPAQCSMWKVSYRNDESLPDQHLNTNPPTKIVLAGAAVSPGREASSRFGVPPCSTVAPVPGGWDCQRLPVGAPWGWGALGWPFACCPRELGGLTLVLHFPLAHSGIFITVLENDVHFLNKAPWLACLLACNFWSLLQAFQVRVKTNGKKPITKQELFCSMLHHHSRWSCSQQSLIPPFHHV